MTMLKEWLGFLREQFPEGSRIRLRKHGDDALEPGIIGILNRITDDAGFCVTWENGQHTELKLGTDSFSVLPAEFQTLKLYMPLTAEIYGRNERGDLDENPTDAGGRHLVKYEDIIAAALRENYMPEEQERGIMHWYEEDTPLDIKVHSIFFGVETRGNCLWGVAECRVAGSLSPLELAELKQYVTSHAADNWGGIFAQRNIQLDDGEMNVYLWNSENWSIQTEQERFAPEQVQPEQQPNEPQGNNRGYTVNGLLAEMEPRYSAYRKTIRECIAGLTGHAAQLAAHGDEEQIPMFRKIIVEMAEFWGLAETDMPEALQKTTDLYQDTFDRAVSAARDSGSAPELSKQAKADILTGLKLYADEMENTGDMGRWIDKCDTLADQLRTEWDMETDRTLLHEMGGWA